MLAVGTQGDIQPFVAVALRLQQAGHRVRIATHGPLRPFVERFGLEFFDIGGDPAVLAEFAVQSKGVFPRGPGQVLKLRAQIKQYVAGQLAACTEPDPAHSDKPFRADAIIANPIGYAHVHVAEAVGAHLHILFTMPWHATSEFGHPQARFLHEKRWRLPPGMQRALQPLLGLINRATFFAVDSAMFTGTADILHAYRTRVLGTGSLFALRHYHRPLAHAPVPTSYTFSPALVPPPADWPAHVHVTGFCRLEAAAATNGYAPPAELEAFLGAGPPPVYVGFGSMTLPDAQTVTRTVFAAIKEAGARAIVSRGWGGLGKLEGEALPPGVLVVGEVPHDWLFPRCSAVVHHGGAGTVATGLLAGCPTMVVPFFGDQPFWGEACRRAGVGPAPVDVDSLTVHRLADGLRVLAQPQVRAAAMRMCARMHAEPDGAQAAADAFLGHFAAARMALHPAVHNADDAVADAPLQAPAGRAGGLQYAVALF
ncbi:hypothetical protein WJX81_001889 [Elliptochloris bilobata]|uniref:Glycosyltransferase family 28 N-terminal domain-containing protein n=1 Tax=Elliptochloris bilobata TaxID=381761 RepID=A0AAW1SBW1_9CHLO